MTQEGFRYRRTRFEKAAAMRRGRRQQPAFAAVRVVDDAGATSPAALEIRLAGGDVIRTDHGLPIERLRTIIRVLRKRC